MTKRDQTLFGDQTFSTPWLVLLDRVWLCLIKFERRQTFDETSYNILFVWTALSNMFYVRMRSGHAVSLVSIDIACFLDSSALWSNMFDTV